MKTATTKYFSNIHHLVLLIFLFTHVSLLAGIESPFHGPADADKQGWELVKSKNGITLYQRWVDTGKAWSSKESYLTFTTAGEIHTVMNTVLDEVLLKDWISSVRKAHAFSGEEPESWYTYLLFDTPWPLKKQDVVLKNTRMQQPGSQTTCIYMVSDTERISEHDGVTRLNSIRITWKITALSTTTTRIQFFIYNDEESTFPHWLTDPIIQNSLIRTMQNLDELIRSQQKKKNTVNCTKHE